MFYPCIFPHIHIYVYIYIYGMNILYCLILIVSPHIYIYTYTIYIPHPHRFKKQYIYIYTYTSHLYPIYIPSISLSNCWLTYLPEKWWSSSDWIIIQFLFQPAPGSGTTSENPESGGIDGFFLMILPWCHGEIMLISWDLSGFIIYMVFMWFYMVVYGILSDSIGMFGGISWDFRGNSWLYLERGKQL